MTPNDRSVRATPEPGTPDGARIVPFPAARSAEVRTHLRLVDGMLGEALADLAQLWRTQLERDQMIAPSGPIGVDVLLDDDLPQLLAELTAGGKRVRPVMAFLGWAAAGGRRRGVGHVEVVRAGAALELLHLFALVHDDVMDGSTTRRGRPSVHVRATDRHVSAGARGCPQRFGESIAILLGDLAHAEADHLAGGLPDPMRRIWRSLVVELVCGQRHDLTGSAGGRHDLRHARYVARAKSGAYTVERPRQRGAAAAGAPDVVTARLSAYGRELGEAFALRDDLLGVWGDPARTGKPIGDDLMSGKPTVLLALAYDRLTGPPAARLRRLTRGDATRADVAEVMEDLERTGLREEVEELIDRHVRAACAALDDDAVDGRVPVHGRLDADGITGLRRIAAEIAWRDR